MNVLGVNTAAYGPGSTIKNFIQSIWPADSTYSPYFFAKAPPPNYGLINSFSDYYDGLCGDNCIETGGIPGM